MNHNSTIIKIPAHSMENLGPGQLIHKGDCGERLEEKFKVRNLEGDDISHAVELSIAASEALVIHELVRSESVPLEIEVVLEAALQMKQARLETFEDVSGCVTEEADGIDFLSDLDDLAMMDAFEDVGFSFSSFSREALVSDKHDRIPQPQGVMDDFEARNPQKAVEEDIETCRTAEGFRSRSFGGWTGKGIVDAPAKPIWKSMPKCFVETSFLSESADVADANSGVQNYESRLLITSQQSVHFKGLHDQGGMDISVSQDVRSINLSSVDPLCSIVPCSVSSGYAGSPPVQKQNCVEPNPENRFNLTNELRAENFPNNSELESPLLICEDSAATVRRQSNSLRPYSTIPFKHDSCLERRHIMLSDKRDPEESLPNTSTVKCIISRDSEEVQKEAAKDKDTSSELQAKNMKKINNGNAKDRALFQVQPSKRTPLILNQKIQPRLQPSRLLAYGSLIKRSPGLASRKNPSSKLRNSSMIENRQVIFQDTKFLLTGFSKIKRRELEGIIQTYGGNVLGDIPSPTNSRRKRKSRSKFLPLLVVLCSKKLETTKFLYGCAINALILKVKWLTDSIAAGVALPPRKYMVLSSQPDLKFLRIGKPVHQDDQTCIFDRVGIMLHGSHTFYTKFAAVIQHGGGRVFKTLHWLVHNLDSEKISIGIIVAENEHNVSRHLRHCASERKIPLMPISWIVKSLHQGKLNSLTTNNISPPKPIEDLEVSVVMDWSQEI